MEDLPPSASPSQSSRTRADHSNKKRSEVHVESEKSVVVDFLSDSSDEDDSSVGGRIGVRSGGGEGVRGGSHEVLLSPPASSKMSGSGQSSIFSERDNDFCIVDTPTSTKVVSPLYIQYSSTSLTV